jgi:hypothetical protein
LDVFDGPQVKGAGDCREEGITATYTPAETSFHPTSTNANASRVCTNAYSTDANSSCTCTGDSTSNDGSISNDGSNSNTATTKFWLIGATCYRSICTNV